MAIDTLEIGTPLTVTPAPPARSRRALLTAALGGMTGLFAARLGTPDPAEAAAGDPLIIGNTTNTAGTANTTLTTASAGTALLVTQNGAGTALRGSAVGPGSIAGFFTANNGTGVSGVTGNPNTYGVFGSNDGALGAGGAIRADGNLNNGLVASTDSSARAAIKATNGGIGPGVQAYSAGGSNTDVHPQGGSAAAGEFAGLIGVIGVTVASDGAGVLGASNGAGTGLYGVSDSGYAGHFQGPTRTTRHLDIDEIAAPTNPAGNIARLFVRDSGGKTELCVIFPTGAIQVIKTEV